MAKNVAKPELVSGTRDLLPSEAMSLHAMVRTIQATYESFGFVPLETPCLERWSTMTGNDPEFNKSIFRAQVVRGVEDKRFTNTDLAGEDTALRFDLTVPLARVVSAYPSLPRPFKRYQIGRVFRGERPQAGRFREFTQFDFDIVGSNSILADVEVIQVMYETVQALNIQDFVIHINSRKILNGLADIVQRSGKTTHLLRAIDKLDRDGIESVKAELMREPDNEYDEAALTLSEEEVGFILSFLDLQNGTSDDTLSGLEALLKSFTSASALDGLIELQAIASLLRTLQVPEKHWRIDLSVARGLDYYTGPMLVPRYWTPP